MGFLRAASVLLPLLITPFLLVGYRRRGRAYSGLLALVILCFGGAALAIAARNVIHPPEWDFQAFWLFGKAATQGGDMYAPGALQRAATGLSFSGEFRREIVDGGLVYPPQALLLFAPFGQLDLRHAALLWMLGVVGTLGVVIWLLWRTFLPDSGRTGLAFTAALTLACWPTLNTVSVAQTNFLLFAFLLLCWRQRDEMAGGAWLALAMSVKPLAGFLALYPLARGNWRALVLCACVVLGLLGVSTVAFGWPTIAGYLASDPSSRLPAWSFDEPANQSLLAVILRTFGRRDPALSPLHHPLFIALAFAITGITVWCIVRLRRGDGDLALALTIPAALLVYPGTLKHYSVYLLAPMLMLVQRTTTGSSAIPTWVVVTLTAECALMWLDLGYLAILANGAMWFTLLYIAARHIQGRAAVHDAHSLLPVRPLPG